MNPAVLACVHVVWLVACALVLVEEVTAQGASAEWAEGKGGGEVRQQGGPYREWTGGGEHRRRRPGSRDLRDRSQPVVSEPEVSQRRGAWMIPCGFSWKGHPCYY